MKPMIIKPDDEDKKIAEETCNKCIEIITKIDRTDLRVFIMQMLIESFEKCHNVQLLKRTLVMDNDNTLNEGKCKGNIAEKCDGVVMHICEECLRQNNRELAKSIFEELEKLTGSFVNYDIVVNGNKYKELKNLFFCKGKEGKNG